MLAIIISEKVMDGLCQLMVVGAQSTPAGIPQVWGAVKKRTLFHTEQLNCDTAQLGGSPGAWWPLSG